MVCAAESFWNAWRSDGIRRGFACAAAALVGATGAAHAQLGPNEKPAEIKGLELKDTLGTQLPLKLELTDSTGKKIQLGDKFKTGRPVVLSMVYLRCPLLCPQMQQKVMASFNHIDLTIGTDYDVMFVSFDPRDSASDARASMETALATYDRVKTESVRQGMSYLVGSAENTQKLADTLGFEYRYLAKSGEFAHGTAVYVITPDGVISRLYTKLDYNPSDMRLALIDASGGKIGTILDLFTLWCYHPTNLGEYVISPMRVMQIGSGISAVLVLGFVGAWAMRDYRRRRNGGGGGGGAVGGGSGGGTNSGQVALSSALGHSR